MTPFHFACRGDHSDVVNILLEKGCDPTLKDGGSPCSSESPSLTPGLLLEAGGQIDPLKSDDLKISVPASSTVETSPSPPSRLVSSPVTRRLNEALQAATLIAVEGDTQ